MSVFFTLLGVAMISYRLFVKGESIIVKNPNWKMRGLACLVIGLLMVTASLYGLDYSLSSPRSDIGQSVGYARDRHCHNGSIRSYDDARVALAVRKPRGQSNP
jgi:hypothetical protein